MGSIFILWYLLENPLFYYYLLTINVEVFYSKFGRLFIFFVYRSRFRWLHVIIFLCKGSYIISEKLNIFKLSIFILLTYGLFYYLILYIKASDTNNYY